MACALSCFGCGKSPIYVYETRPEIIPIPEEGDERSELYERVYRSIRPLMCDHFRVDQIKDSKPDHRSRANFHIGHVISRPSDLDNQKLIRAIQDAMKVTDVVGGKILLKLYKPHGYEVLSTSVCSSVNFLGLKHIGLTNLFGVFVFDRRLNQVVIRCNKEELSAEDIVVGEILEHGGDFDFKKFIQDGAFISYENIIRFTINDIRKPTNLLVG
jgi:hypothetical protein